jgi:uncharacterized membrane protein HdeD (DUF308 family)
MKVNLTAPSLTTWWIAVILGVLGILAAVVPIPALSPYAFWLVAVAFVIFVIATLTKGL